MLFRNKNLSGLADGSCNGELPNHASAAEERHRAAAAVLLARSIVKGQAMADPAKSPMLSAAANSFVPKTFLNVNCARCVV